jgi:hypothetical protein
MKQKWQLGVDWNSDDGRLDRLLPKSCGKAAQKEGLSYPSRAEEHG